MNMIKACYYNLNEKIMEDKITKEDGDTVFLLGMKHQEQNLNIMETFLLDIHSMCQNTIRFTYREGFDQLLKRSGGYTNDIGWGCLLRAGQMSLAQMIRKHTKQSDQKRLLLSFADIDKYDQYTRFAKKIEKKMFKRPNSQLTKFPYSIQKIMLYCNIIYKTEPGTFLSPTAVSNALQDLYALQPFSNNLKVIAFNEQNLCYQQAANRILGIEDNCQHEKNEKLKLQQEINFQDESYVEDDMEVFKPSRKSLQYMTSNFIPQQNGYYCKECILKEEQNSLIIYINAKFNKKGFLNRIMEFPQFQGFLGGQGSKGYYFIGKIKEKLIFLDPHCVHQAVSEQNIQTKKQFDSFKLKKLRFINQEKVEESVSLCFYIKDINDLNALYRKLGELKYQFPECYINLQDRLEIFEDQEEEVDPGFKTDSSNESFR